jgi:uncharacterized membrane protein YcaP (DUF421 family)
LVVLLIADAAQNGMARDARFATPRTVLLVQNGRVLRKNLEREMITEDELNSQLRQSGVDELTTVKCARLEPDGHISVIKSSQTEVQRKRGGHPGAA